MKNIWWILVVVALFVVIGIDVNTQLKTISECKKLRIRPYTEKLFTFNGIVELIQKGEYQPKCI